MKAKKIDHVGIVVRDLGAAVATFEANFGFEADPARGGDVSAMGIRNAFIPVGESDLELFESTASEGPVARFAQERGEGLFMVSIEVEDVAGAVAHLRGLGSRVTDPSPAGVAYVSMKSTHGVNLHLVQRSQGPAGG
ncbi:MAG: VOC family protein [Tepidiformaceae bacterium]